MPGSFAENIKTLRTQKNISQQKLAQMLFVDRSTIAGWEIGRRIPDAVMISRIAACLDADVGALLASAQHDADPPNVIVVDDEKIILLGSTAVIRKAMPFARVSAFRMPSAALEFARGNRVDLAFLDIELGSVSGLELCRELLEINPSMNVIFLTAYSGYSLDAWGTGASGFMLKPVTPEGLAEQLQNLRHPLPGGGESS